VIVEQDVFALEIAMSNVLGMQVLNGEYDAVKHRSSLVFGQRASAQYVFEQVATLGLLHDDAGVGPDANNLSTWQIIYFFQEVRSSVAVFTR
jgi:hypothetical protein